MLGINKKRSVRIVLIKKNGKMRKRKLLRDEKKGRKTRVFSFIQIYVHKYKIEFLDK